MLTLGIETATHVCSVALFEDKRLLDHRSTEQPRSHAAQLVPLVGQLLDDTGNTPMALDLIAVSAGPGSYTGLRIGASTAKGLAFSADAALVAVPSLEAMALSAWLEDRNTPNSIVAVFPSRRGEVYVAAYSVEENLTRCISEPAAISLEDIANWLPDGPLTFAGPAAEIVTQATETANPDGGITISYAKPSAVAVARLGLQRYKNGFMENVAEWEPFYLKSFVAKPPKPIF